MPIVFGFSGNFFKSNSSHAFSPGIRYLLCFYHHYYISKGTSGQSSRIVIFLQIKKIFILTPLLTNMPEFL